MDKISKELIQIANELSLIQLQQQSDILLKIKKDHVGYTIVFGVRYYRPLYGEEVFDCNITLQDIIDGFKNSNSMLNQIHRSILTKYSKDMAGITNNYIIKHNDKLYVCFMIQQLNKDLLTEVTKQLKSNVI